MAGCCWGSLSSHRVGARPGRLSHGDSASRPACAGHSAFVLEQGPRSLLPQLPGARAPGTTSGPPRLLAVRAHRPSLSVPSAGMPWTVLSWGHCHEHFHCLCPCCLSRRDRDQEWPAGHCGGRAWAGVPSLPFPSPSWYHGGWSPNGWQCEGTGTSWPFKRRSALLLCVFLEMVIGH